MARGSAYASPKAFRRALTDKLKGLATESRWDLPQLQRQIAYDRLLERLYAIDEGWVVKGATALLARDLGVRGTIDIDLLREGKAENGARELREAAALDLGDWFEFEAGPSQPVNDAAGGLRVPIKALIGTIEQRGYRAYPLVDHVADKVVATFDRYGVAEAVSTRYKDLVDLVAIATAASVEAGAQIKALDSEAGRRQVTLPARFDVPSRELWERGYAAEAGRSLLDVAPTLGGALGIVRPFLDPVLDGSARGAWNPTAVSWDERT